MLSRRNLRVKVMQVIYSIEHNNHMEPAEAVQVRQLDASFLETRGE